MILFVVNDAGPAKYISYIMIKLGCNDYHCISSDISSKVFDTFNFKYNIDFELKDIKLIITGTCLGDGIDKQWIKIGKENNIKTISIIEHWSLYKKRFEINGKYNFPDLIFVNDNVAKKEAIHDGIPKDLMKIVGNPVFENIIEKEYTEEIKISWKTELNIENNKKIITFISEEYKSDFPKGSLEYQGFDEFEVLEDIIDVLDSNTILLIKLHPAEDKNKYNYLTKNKNIIVIDKTDINKLIEFSDIFIGMGSMLLLEASFVKNNVYTYRPNETIEFIGNKNKMTINIENKEDLKNIILNTNQVKKEIVPNNFIGSTDKIIQLIQEYIG